MLTDETKEAALRFGEAVACVEPLPDGASDTLRAVHADLVAHGNRVAAALVGVLSAFERSIKSPRSVTLPGLVTPTEHEREMASLETRAAWNVACAPVAIGDTFLWIGGYRDGQIGEVTEFAGHGNGGVRCWRMAVADSRWTFGEDFLLNPLEFKRVRIVERAPVLPDAPVDDDLDGPAGDEVVGLTDAGCGCVAIGEQIARLIAAKRVLQERPDYSSIALAAGGLFYEVDALAALAGVAVPDMAPLDGVAS